MKTSLTTPKFLLCGCVVAIMVIAAIHPVGSSSNAPVPPEAKKAKSDHIMLGGTPSRNMVNLIDKNVPDKVDLDGRSVLWKAELGSRAYGGPTIANGRVYVGTNNETRVPRNLPDTLKNKDGEIEPVDRGI